MTIWSPFRPCSSTTARLAELDVLAHERVVRVAGDVADVLRLGVGGHLQGVFVVGVEDGGVLGDLDDEALHLGELVERVDAAEAEVVGGDVEDRADVAEAVAEAGADDAAAGGLDDGHVDGRVAQHHARRTSGRSCRPSP